MGSKENKPAGLPVFRGQGLSAEDALKKEAEVFDQLASGKRPEVLAAQYGCTVPTIYAIDKREAARRGVGRNLGPKNERRVS